MKSVLVCVGDEILAGVIVNTNAAMIGELMQAVGAPVDWSISVGDTEDAIADAIRRAVHEADIVIVTGGLGPTQDDLTREAIARLLGTDLVRDEAIVDDIRARFRSFGRDMPESNAKQADIPAGARAIPNPWGTAPGIRAELDGAVIYAIPGVPGEARRMLDEQIIPELGGGTTIRARMLKCVGLPESELADRFHDLATADNPKMAFLPGGGEIRLRFVATGAGEAECERLLDEAERVVRERAGDFVYGIDTDTLEQVVGGLLASRGLTVATAESCTAGMLSARMASVPGASRYLVGGVVAYASEVKTAELDVPPELIERHGAVSEEVTAAMASGAKKRFDADVGVAITCVAGPDPQDGVQPGQMVLALAGLGGQVDVRSVRVPGDREQVRQFATTFALSFLRAHLA
ncbi:MAG TPA: competence/damage-inducible protein A [Actinomycetota bacterium]|jgi:nicotinamide-nucleotide amidase|nr:competence/damage-inducible protein A [Actinomycetota bacterium]